MIKHHNKPTEKNTTVPFEPYVRNLLGTSAIIYEFAGEAFLKRKRYMSEVEELKKEVAELKSIVSEQKLIISGQNERISKQDKRIDGLELMCKAYIVINFRQEGQLSMLEKHRLMRHENELRPHTLLGEIRSFSSRYPFTDLQKNYFQLYYLEITIRDWNVVLKISLDGDDFDVCLSLEQNKLKYSRRGEIDLPFLSFTDEVKLGCGAVFPPPNESYYGPIPYVFFTWDGSLIGKGIRLNLNDDDIYPLITTRCTDPRILNPNFAMRDIKYRVKPVIEFYDDTEWNNTNE
ncbi:hypothetical protein ACQ4LE_007594 [Meloidogyne hapla]